jgi:hypothetical protein
LARSRARTEAHPGPDPVAAGQDAEAGRPCHARHGLSLPRPIKAGCPRAPRPGQLRRPSPAPAQKPPPPCYSLSRTARIRPAPLTSNPAGSVQNPPMVSAPRDSPCFLVRFLPFSRLLIACAAGTADGQELLSIADLLCVLRKKMTVLCLTPCEILKIIRSTFESCTFPRKPPGKIRFLRSNPSQALL